MIKIKENGGGIFCPWVIRIMLSDGNESLLTRESSAIAQDREKPSQL
jgi:hypothetical protein